MQTTCTSESAAVSVIYATCPDLDTARSLGRTVIEEGLAACVNCLPGMTSIYRWEGAIQESTEVVLICKTSASQAMAVRHRLAQLHPYAIPCIVELSTVAANPDFAAWISSQVASG